MAKVDLREAKKAKNDEFYTQLSDIGKEVKHYKRNTSDYYSKAFSFKYTSILTKLILGYFVGAHGYAIFKQIQLSRIAYF